MTVPGRKDDWLNCLYSYLYNLSKALIIVQHDILLVFINPKWHKSIMVFRPRCEPLIISFTWQVTINIMQSWILKTVCTYREALLHVSISRFEEIRYQISKESMIMLVCSLSLSRVHRHLTVWISNNTFPLSHRTILRLFIRLRFLRKKPRVNVTTSLTLFPKMSNLIGRLSCSKVAWSNNLDLIKVNGKQKPPCHFAYSSSAESHNFESCWLAKLLYETILYPIRLISLPDFHRAIWIKHGQRKSRLDYVAIQSIAKYALS